jgi:hypothetical protein
VRAQVLDVSDRAHHFVDKAPVFGVDVDFSEQVPVEGRIRCLVLGTGSAGDQPSVLVSTSPDHLEPHDVVVDLHKRPDQLADDESP